MSGINKAILVGRLSRDPEIRYTSDGRAIANFTIVTSEEWKDKNTGEKKERTEFHRCVAFNRLGEICGEYLHKGKQVYIEGLLRTRQWEKDGITRYITEIEALTMQMLGGRNDSGNRNSSQRQSGQDQYNSPMPDDRDIPFQRKETQVAVRSVYCEGCNLYLGEIRDAKLRKGIVYLCKNCETKRIASDLARQTKKKDSIVDDVFGDIFKPIGGL